MTTIFHFMKKIFIFLLFTFSLFISIAQSKSPHINHIALSVHDLAKSQFFYSTVLGFDTIPEPFHDGRHVWFSIGDRGQLHLIQTPPPLVIPLKGTHLCFSVPGMKPFISSLEKHKVLYEDWPGKQSAITTRADGVHQIYFQDPDGYWIEINDDYK